jgi:aquaporin Z
VTLVAIAIDVLYYRGAHVEYVSRWLARGFITTAMIYAFAKTSGAHLDPAVTLGFALRGVVSLRRATLYIAAQFAGAFSAAGVAFAMWGSQLSFGASRPGLGVSPAVAVVTEVLLTFLLMLVILRTVESGAAIAQQAGVAVGLTIVVAGLIGGSISGASMNPARSIAPQILTGMYGIVWIYAVGPCVGAALAALAATALFGKPDAGEREAAAGE